MVTLYKVYKDSAKLPMNLLTPVVVVPSTAALPPDDMLHVGLRQLRVAGLRRRGRRLLLQEDGPRRSRRRRGG